MCNTAFTGQLTTSQLAYARDLEIFVESFDLTSGSLLGKLGQMMSDVDRSRNRRPGTRGFRHDVLCDTCLSNGERRDGQLMVANTLQSRHGINRTRIGTPPSIPGMLGN